MGHLSRRAWKQTNITCLFERFFGDFLLVVRPANLCSYTRRPPSWVETHIHYFASFHTVYYKYESVKISENQWKLSESQIFSLILWSVMIDFDSVVIVQTYIKRTPRNANACLRSRFKTRLFRWWPRSEIWINGKTFSVPQQWESKVKSL